jgi:hypothetical protein
LLEGARFEPSVPLGRSEAVCSPKQSKKALLKSVSSVDDDSLTGAEAGLHQIQARFGAILRPADPANWQPGADALECCRPFGFRQSMPELGIDSACAYPIDP